jgi:hypothetical protein
VQQGGRITGKSVSGKTGGGEGRGGGEVRGGGRGRERGEGEKGGGRDVYFQIV